MRKREQGILTVEASIVLTLMTLFVLFLFSFIRVYRAENVVSHATLQAADAMALESYLRENAMDDQADDVVYLANRLTGSTSLSTANFESLRSANVPTLAKEKFIAAVSNSESNADALLEIYGVKDGLSGIDFSSSTIDLDKDDVIVSVSYTLKMQFPIFGGTELSVTKTAKAKTFGKILFEIIAEPEDHNMGSTSGSGNYQHGSTIQITANPNYGYKFVKWDDGNTDNPRIVPVTEAHKYIAIFEADSFGINTVITPADAGSATGEGTYTYLSTANFNATANPGYHFEKWSVYQHKDSTTAFVATPDVSQTVDQSYTYTANFVPNTYTIKVVSSGAAGTVTVKSGASFGESINVTFGSSFDLIQTPPTGYVFKGWKVEGGTSYISPTSGISVPTQYPNGSVIPNNATIIYTAYYEIAKYDVSVASAGNGSVSGGGTYEHGKNISIVATPSSGYEFNYWTLDGLKTSLPATASVVVNSPTSYRAFFKKAFVTITLDPMGGTIDGKSGTQSYQINYDENSKSLPKPLQQGYVFAGWNLDGTNYNDGTIINNVKGNITLRAKWSSCTSHERGRCGTTHTIDKTTLNQGTKNEVKNVTECQCYVCVKCGAFLNPFNEMVSSDEKYGVGKYYGCKDEICWYVYKYNDGNNASYWDKNKKNAKDYGIDVHAH